MLVQKMVPGTATVELPPALNVRRRWFRNHFWAVVARSPSLWAHH